MKLKNRNDLLNYKCAITKEVRQRSKITNTRAVSLDTN